MSRWLDVQSRREVVLGAKLCQNQHDATAVKIRSWAYSPLTVCLSRNSDPISLLYLGNQHQKSRIEGEIDRLTRFHPGGVRMVWIQNDVFLFR